VGRKVLHLIGQLVRGGAERQLVYLSQCLSERGWAQAVVTFNPGDVWEEKLVSQGVPVLHIPRSKSKLLRLARLNLLAAREHPQLIHSWSHHTNVYARWMLACRSVPKIFSFRSNPLIDSFSGTSRERVSNAEVYSAAACIVSNSQASLDAARAGGVRMRRTAVVGNIAYPRGRATPGKTGGVFRVVAVGALTPLKGFDTLLRSVAILEKKGQSLQLVVLGDGPERARLLELREQLGLSDLVTFRGSVDNVPEILSEAHLLVHPSRCEGLSNSVLEGMGEGLPVVATKVGGTPELISNELQLVLPDSPGELAEKILAMMGDPDTRAALGAANLRLVSQRCSPDTVTSQYESIYKSVISSGS